MEDLLSELSPWITIKGLLIEKNISVTISLLLQNGSMTYPFLYIQEKDKKENFCLIPVTRLIDVRFTPTSVLFTFQEYNQAEIYGVFLEPKSFEIFLSQFRLCAYISRNTIDSFFNENCENIQNFISRKPPGYSLTMYNLYDSKGVISPVTFFKGSEDVWKERTTLINTLYFTETVPIKLNLMTWNVGCATPANGTREELENCINDNPDIAFYSLQEIDMSTKSVVTGSSSHAIEWKESIQEAIKYTDLEIVEQESLGGTFALVALNKTNKNLKFKGMKSARLGAHGLAANKSVILFTVQAGFANITLCACHLSAHDNDYEVRNQQLIKIQKLVPKNTDYLFICGDLNYRVNIPYSECVPLANEGRTDELLAKDQLSLQIKTVKELSDLKEGDIYFKPTYRFDKGSDVYDTSQKRRTPSYTDRVLVRTFPPRLTTGLVDSFCFETDVMQHYADERITFPSPSYFSPVEPEPNYPIEPTNVLYDSGANQLSDHRPVHSQWELMIPGTNEKRKQEFEDLMKKKFNEFTSLENPKGIVSPSALTLKVGEKVNVVLENTSLVWAHWGAQSLSDYIKVYPTRGVSIPGIPMTVEIEVSGYFEGQQFVLFNCKQGTYCSVEVTVEK